MPLPALYGEYANWFHLLTSPEDYEEEADLYLRLLREGRGAKVGSLLELGSGGGNNASWYSREVPEVVLSDLSPAMLEISKTINPRLEHVVGDMRTLRLGRIFDAVFVHDAIAYLTTEADLEACFQTAAAHLAPAGVALFVPDCVRETYTDSTHQGGHDSADGRRGLRYLEWSRDPDPGDVVFEVDFACLLREGDAVKVIHDHHTCGVFPRATWMQLLDRAGFEVLQSPRLEWDDSANEQVAFVARKRA